MDIAMIANQIIWGLLIGVGYSLLAIGFSLIYASTEAINFAQGEYAMIGAYIFFTLLSILHLNVFIAVPITIILCFLLGILIEKIAFRRLYKLDVMLVVICTIGISTMLKNIALIIWGPNSITLPELINIEPIKIGSLTIITKNIILLVIGVLVMIIFHVFMTKTKIGTSMRAVAQNKKAASLMGINIKRSISLTWGLGAMIAGIGGILIAFVYNLSIDMGSLIGIKGFAAAVLGGFGNIVGAMFGGLLMGVTENLGAFLISYYYKDIISFVILIIILLIKPTGLFIRGRMFRKI